MSWNPDLYHKSQTEHTAPFYDLPALVDVRLNLKAVDLGCGSGELTRQPHVLADLDEVVEWISGTALVPYFERLGGSKDAFIQSIRAKMKAAMLGGPVFYPFRRTLFSARKPKQENTRSTESRRLYGQTRRL
jgi:trans-aconitate methyltransferase